MATRMPPRPLSALGENCYLQGMSSEGQTAAPHVRFIAGGEGWSVSEFLCRAGPSDRPVEERHDGFSIAAVIEGTFTCKAEHGEALLHPGALLFGNHGACFACGHDHSRGDRCISFNFAPDAFAEIAASAAGSSRFAFPAAMAPAHKASTPILVAAEAIGGDAEPLRVEETAMRLAETVVATISGHAASTAPVSALEHRRIADVLRHIEDHAADPLDLDALAGVARLSKYHFLRVFRRAIGMTPYQFLLNVRMRRAAVRLARPSETILRIAFDVGFGDLSTFNKSFREIFGMSPSAFRGGRRL
jgi:AraC family transcriptional regulator